MFKVATILLTFFVLSNASYKGANSPAYYGFSPNYSPYRPSYGLATHASYPGPSYAHPKPSYIYAQPSYAEPAYEHKPSPYSFGYKVNDGYGNSNFQSEEGDDYGAKKGSYGYTDAQGVYRKVDYIADKHGFRAYVSTNEPGTSPQAPADVKWNAKPSPEYNMNYAASYAPASYIAPSYKAHATPYHPKYTRHY